MLYIHDPAAGKAYQVVMRMGLGVIAPLRGIDRKFEEPPSVPEGGQSVIDCCKRQPREQYGDSREDLIRSRMGSVSF